MADRHVLEFYIDFNAQGRVTINFSQHLMSYSYFSYDAVTHSFYQALSKANDDMKEMRERMNKLIKGLYDCKGAAYKIGAVAYPITEIIANALSKDAAP